MVAAAAQTVRARGAVSFKVSDITASKQGSGRHAHVKSLNTQIVITAYFHAVDSCAWK